jgi:type I restriction enzyme S subunit
MATSQDFVNWVCSPQIDPEFLKYLFMAEGDGLLWFASGAVHQTIYFPEAKAFHICHPSRAEQQRIVRILDEAIADIVKAKANAEKCFRQAKEVFRCQLQKIIEAGEKVWGKHAIGGCTRFIDYRGKTPVKTTSGLRLITAKNVKFGYLQNAPQEFVSPLAYDSWMTRGIPQRGDVLFTTEAPLGNVAQLDTDEKVVFAQRIIIMQPDASRLDAAFLKYVLLSQPIQERIHRKGTGATVKGIKASLLKTVEIAFPSSIDEQKGIATELDKLGEEVERLCSVYQRKLAALDELKQSLLHRAFSGQL